MRQRTYASANFQTKSPKFFLIVGSLILLCVVLGLFSVYRYFRVVHIQCTQSGVSCESSVTDLLSMYQGRSLFQEMKPTILGKKVSIQKKYPQTLIVTLANQEILTPIYIDEAKQIPALLYTDATLQKIPLSSLSTSSAQLAITDLTQATLLDSTVLSQERYAVYTNLLEFSKTTVVKEIVIKSFDEIEIRTQRELTAIVSSQSLQNQLHSLQLLLASPTIEQKPARVDLRFDQPVLQYNE